MSQELFNRFRKAAGRDYTCEQVINAACALIINAVMREHERLPAAQEQVDHIAASIKYALRTERYSPDGLRKGIVSVDPGVTRWLLSEGALRPQDIGLKEKGK